MSRFEFHEGFYRGGPPRFRPARTPNSTWNLAAPLPYAEPVATLEQRIEQLEQDVQELKQRIAPSLGGHATAINLIHTDTQALVESQTFLDRAIAKIVGDVSRLTQDVAGVQENLGAILTLILARLPEPPA